MTSEPASCTIAQRRGPAVRSNLAACGGVSASPSSAQRSRRPVADRGAFWPPTGLASTRLLSSVQWCEQVVFGGLTDWDSFAVNRVQ